MSDDAPIELELDGRNYRRYPGCGRKNAERYYTCTSGKGFRVYHRDFWEKHHGKIPDGFHIHHVDENPLNNSIENLECLSPADHAQRHVGGEHSEWSRHHINEIRILASEWHGSPAGIAWHREHGKRTWIDREQADAGECANCKTPLLSYFAIRKSREGKRYCSRYCHRAVADAEDRYTVDATCPICEKLFKARKWGKRPETCSRLCGAALRKSRRELAACKNVSPRTRKKN